MITIKMPDLNRGSIAAACRWSVLFLNVLAILSLIAYGIRSGALFGEDTRTTAKPFLAALYSVLISTGVCSYCFVQKRISDKNVGGDGAAFVSAACASHTFICFILFGRSKVCEKERTDTIYDVCVFPCCLPLPTYHCLPSLIFLVLTPTDRIRERRRRSIPFRSL